MSPPPTAPRVARARRERSRAASPARICASSPAQAACTMVEHLARSRRPAVVGVGHVEVAPPRAGRVELAQQAAPSRARPRSGASARSSRRFERSIASIRSNPRSPRRAPAARRPSSAIPRPAAAAVARASGGLPTCQRRCRRSRARSRSCSPASRTSARITPSAVGERQMLPRQTNSTPHGLASPSTPRRARAPPGRPPGAPRRGRPASSASCPPSVSRAAFSCA